MTFDAIGIAGTGLTVHRKWLDAVSDNLANVNTATTTSRRRLPGPLRGGRRKAPGDTGVYVAGAALRRRRGPAWSTSRTNPLADANGNVRYPDIDLAAQMGQLIMAQRGYQANAGRRGPRRRPATKPPADWKKPDDRPPHRRRPGRDRHRLRLPAPGPARRQRTVPASPPP